MTISKTNELTSQETINPLNKKIPARRARAGK
jgi:hypothetical protein